MSAIAGSFFTQFPATGELGLSLTSIQGGTSTEANAASILGTAVSSDGGPFSILSANSATTSASPTVQALTTGELSNEDHKVIASIGGTATDSLLIPYNADGSVPTEIANLVALGWIKLDTLQITPGQARPTGGNYSLTPVGQAIYKRTVATTLGPGTQAAIANASAPSTANASSVDSGLQAEVSTLVGALSSVGVDVQV
jgi:hypothetical protein